MGEWDATAQAVELIRALLDQLHQMTTRLSRLERQDVGTSDQASAIRSEVAALRSDINEAQAHIDRLQRHYFDGEHTRPGLTVTNRANQVEPPTGKMPPD